MAVIHGTPGPDNLHGGKSGDEISGAAGNDALYGEDGDDLLTGGSGNDTLDGGYGPDTAVYSLPFSSYTVSFDHATGRYRISSAADGSDWVKDVEFFRFADQTLPVAGIYQGLGGGTTGADTLYGTPDADTLEGLDGPDHFFGGEGDDKLYGDAGSDAFFAESGNDTLFGGPGHDFMYGGAGNDSIDGGEGHDGMFFEYVTGPVTVDLATGVATGEGTDKLVSIEDTGGGPFDDSITGDGADNWLWGGEAGSDTIVGGAGNDTIRGGLGNDSLDGGSGSRDVLEFSPYSLVPVEVDLQAGRATGEGEDSFAGFEAVDCTWGSDTVAGSSATDIIHTKDGDDTLMGRGGDDFLNAGPGHDWLEGGTGNDGLSGDYEPNAADFDVVVFSGSRSQYMVTTAPMEPDRFIVTDKVVGRDGTDTVRFVAFFQFADGLYTPLNLLSGAGTSTSGNSSANMLIGTTENDSIAGLAGDDTLRGGDGSDTLVGGDGNDLVVGGAGDDVLIAGPGSRDVVSYEDLLQGVLVALSWGPGLDAGGDTLVGFDDVIGSAHNDTLYGSAGPNILMGGAGNDLLDGAEGTDTLDGGGGRDVARFGGDRAQFAVDRLDDGWAVAGPDGSDILSSVERLQMTDGFVALDIEHAQIGVRLLGAAFGSAAAANQLNRGIVINMLDGGLSALQVAGEACNLLGWLDNPAFVNRVYGNLTGRAPSPAEQVAFTWLLDSGAYSRPSLLLLAAQTEWCAELVGVDGFAQTGIAYT